LIFDAIRIRLLEIGEAVKELPKELLDTQPAIPWREITRMRDHLAHRYFDTAHAILQATVDDDLPGLERAVREMVETLPEEGQPVQDDSRAHPAKKSCQARNRQRLRELGPDSGSTHNAALSAPRWLVSGRPGQVYQGTALTVGRADSITAGDHEAHPSAHVAADLLASPATVSGRPCRTRTADLSAACGGRQVRHAR
jgi:Protein of unknown function DUF86